LEVPISLYEAMFGAKVDVPTLEGRRTITIPAGTSSGAKLRIKSHGIQRGEEKGDQIVITKIIVPRQLDEEDRKSIERLKAKRPLDPRADLNW
jgi:DnaJ-class molecular chaperone